MTLSWKIWCINVKAVLDLPTQAEASIADRGADRWFWMTVSVMWKNWRQALLIVHPDTVVRWQRERFRRHWGGLSSKPGRIGRPPIKREIRRLIQTLAKANPLWRAPRIHGELKKLGIAVSERTVSRVLRSIPQTAFAELEKLSAEPHGRDGSD